jgi:hypothetical protein
MNPGSWNRYAYVENDPVNFNDPRGLAKCLVGVGEGAEWVECEYVTFVVPSFVAHKIREYIDYMQKYASGLGKAKQAIADLAKGDFRSKQKCREFFQALNTTANLKIDVDTLMDQVISVARDAQNYIYDGVHSGTQLTAAEFPSTASPGVTTVDDWFAVDSGRQALSQYNGYAIFIRPDQWVPHTGSMTEFLSGNVNQYGMGTLMHELLHKRLISGGFGHSPGNTTMTDALKAVGMASGSLFKNAESEYIGKLCF